MAGTETARHFDEGAVWASLLRGKLYSPIHTDDGPAELREAGAAPEPGVR